MPSIKTFRNGGWNEASGRTAVDPSLTKPGQAADAKATGEAIGQLGSQTLPKITGSGAAVAYEAGRNSPLYVTSIMGFHQNGSGSPAPTNLRSLRRWESVGVSVMGKNLLYVADGETTVNGVTAEVSGGRMHLHGTASARAVFYLLRNEQNFSLIPGNYTVQTGENIGNGVSLVLDLKKKNLAYIRNLVNLKHGDTAGFEIRAEEGDDQIIAGYVAVDSGTTVDITLPIQIETGDASAFEKYRKVDYSVQIPPSVYGGSCDWRTGEVSATWVGGEYDASEDEKWSVKQVNNDDYLVHYGAIPTQAPRNAKGACNMAPYRVAYGGNCVFFEGGNLVVGAQLVSALGGADAFLASIKSKPLQAAVNLPFPYIANAEPKTVLMEQGKSYVSAVGGTISIIGYSPIDRAFDEVKANSAAIAAIRDEAYTSGVLPLPPYYSTYIAEKSAAVDSAMAKANDGFCFVTDNHLRDNELSSFPCMRYILQHTSLDKTIYNGDSIPAYGEDEDIPKYAKLNRDLFKALPGRVYLGRGNHDFEIKRSAGIDAGYTYGMGYTYNMLTRVQEGYANTVPGKCYCYWDNVPQKIRYINVDTQDAPASEGPTPAGVAIGISQEQLTWLSQTMLGAGEGWHILVIGHVPCDSKLPAYATPLAPLHTMLTDYINRRGDFTQAKGTIIMYLCGHNHKDRSAVTDGLLSVSTTCDARYAEDGNPRVAGTISENAFDVVTLDLEARTVRMVRIGAGLDRTFTY